MSKTTADSTTESIDEDGFLNLESSSGQSLSIPIQTTVFTPFLVGSSATMQFGVCHVHKSTEGMFLLSNITMTPGHWKVINIPNGGISRRQTNIPVREFQDVVLENDDPSVFKLFPMEGILCGPTVSVSAAIAAPPKDVMRR